MPATLATLAVAAFFAAIHAVSPSLTLFGLLPRGRWLSFAGGISVAYVFVHILPELAGAQADLSRTAELVAAESELFLVALIGLSLFYGLESLAGSPNPARQAAREGRRSDPAFWIHLTSFSIYNMLIGYLLVHREDTSLRGLAFYALALGLHFLVNDRSLSRHHGRLHDSIGRWVLSVAVLAGWAIGVTSDIHRDVLALLFAFLAGGIMLNVLKEELPGQDHGRFGAFALGAAAFAMLAMVL